MALVHSAQCGWLMGISSPTADSPTNWKQCRRRQLSWHHLTLLERSLGQAASKLQAELLALLALGQKRHTGEFPCKFNGQSTPAPFHAASVHADAMAPSTDSLVIKKDNGLFFSSRENWLDPSLWISWWEGAERMLRHLQLICVYKTRKVMWPAFCELWGPLLGTFFCKWVDLAPGSTESEKEYSGIPISCIPGLVN